MSVLLTDMAVKAEQGALGVMLYDPEAAGLLCQKLVAEDFIIEEFRQIFAAVKHVYGQGLTPDVTTVAAALKGEHLDLLQGLWTVTVTSANAEAYAETCRETARQRRLAEYGEQIAKAEDDPERQQAIVDKIIALGCEKPGARITGLRQCYEEFLDRHADGKKPAYFTWGIPALDDLIYVERGDFIVLGGYPSAGKTALALQMAFHVAKAKRVGYFYYENNDKKLFDRLVASRTKVSFGKIKRYDLQEEDFTQIVSVQNTLIDRSLEFIDASGMTVSDVRALALSRHYDLAVADYLQKIPGNRARRGLSDFERVTEVSSDLQDLGRQTGVTVLALSQLNRPEKGKPSFPGMHSFRQSGQIEQDADVALLLFREDENDPDNQVRTMKIGKNKEGAAGISLSMHFDGDTQTFSRVFPQAQPKPANLKAEAPPFRQEVIELPGRDDGLPF